MASSLSVQPGDRPNQVLRSLWEVGSWCWSGSATGGRLSASKGLLRQFLLLKLATVLLLPHSAGVLLLVGCVFSRRVFLLLRSPHTSTKPSTVFLGHLACTDSLALLSWMLQLGGTVAWWMEERGQEMKAGPVKEAGSAVWREVMNLLCQQLHDAHHLASLLLLGLVGLEATLVSRWPQQTRRFRTSRWAQLSCCLVWIVVLLELLSGLHFTLHTQDSTPQRDSSAPLNPQVCFLPLVPLPSLPAFSSALRRALWLVNSWLHYTVFYSKPQKRKSLFH